MKEGVAGSLSIKTSVYNIIRLRLVCTWLSWHQHLKILAHACPNFQAYLRIIVRYWEPCSGSTKSYKTYAPKTWVAAGMGKGEGHLPPPPHPCPLWKCCKVFLCISSYSKKISRRIIYAVFSKHVIGFWGLHPQTPIGAPFLDFVRRLSSPDP